LLTFIEEYDDQVDRGVHIDRLEAYADALDERGVQSVGAEQMDALVEADRTDSATWVDADAIYDVGDGFNAFPARWHDELRGGGRPAVCRRNRRRPVGWREGDGDGATGDGVPRTCCSTR